MEEATAPPGSGGHPAQGWKGASLRSKLKLIAFSLVPVALLLVLAQLYAYMTIHRTIITETDSITGLTYYSMQIGRWPWSHRSFTPLNSLGLPDEEYVNVLPKGDCVHVLFAGDSFVFGDGTDRDLNFFTLVKRMSEVRNHDRCLRFFNVSERNSTIDVNIDRLRETMPLIEPDVIIYGQYQNDLSDLTNFGSVAWTVPDETRRYDNQWGDRLRRAVPGYDLSLVRYGTYRLFRFLVESGIQYDVLKTWSVIANEDRREEADRLMGIYRDLYAGMVSDLREQDIRLAVLILPSKMDVMAKRYPEGEFFRALADDFDVPYLELLPVLDANRKPFPFYTYDGHLNERGNAVVAGAIWEWLFEADYAPIRLVRCGGGSSRGTDGDGPSTPC